MNAINRYIQLTKESLGDFSQFYGELRLSFYFIIFLMMISTMKDLVILDTLSMQSIILEILCYFLLMVFTVNIILVRKAIDLNQPKESVIANMLTFALTGFCTLVIVGVGLIFFVIPGILALLYLYLAPLISIYEDEEGLAPLKKSRFLIGKSELFLTFLLFVIPLLSQFVLLKAANYFDMTFKIIFLTGSSLFLAFIHVIVTLMSVRLYYYLRSIRISSLVSEIN